MINRSHAISIIGVYIISLSLAFSATGCQGDVGPLEDKTDQVKFMESVEKEIYTYPGNAHIFTLLTETDKCMPGDPVYIWTVYYEGSIAGEIIHDRYVKADPDKAYDYNEADEWPYTEKLRYEFLSEGTYKIRADLYDINEYAALKNLAPRRGTHEFTIYCYNVTVSISTEPTGESREYTFKATFDNNKGVDSYDIPEWKFVDTKTGNIDQGKTENFTKTGDIYNNGTSEVTHQFEKDGDYRITVSLKNDKDEIIATGETMLIIKGIDLIIVAPQQQPLKTGQDYTFTARTDYPETLPETPSYEWDFGDGSGIIIPFSNEATHSFDQPGKYVIYVEIFDSQEEAANVIGSAYLTINVEESPDYIAKLHEMKYFDLDFMISGTLSNGNNRSYSIGLDDKGAEVVWDGTNFSIFWDYYSFSGNAAGQVSPDGTQIEHMILQYDWESGTESTWYRLEIVELPLWEDTYNYMFLQRTDDEDVKKYVSSFTTNESFNADWNGDVLLNVYFSKKPF